MKRIFFIHKDGMNRRYFWFFNKIRINFHRCKYWDIEKGNSAIWIEMPFIDIKIKRNYKGHFIC